MNDRVEILPCPCCAAQALLFVNPLFVGEKAMYIECTDCGVGTPEIYFGPDKPGEEEKTARQLRAIWNRRQELEVVETNSFRRVSKCSDRALN